MLVLVSFVLVLAAAVTLVVGLLQSGLTLIYLSIGCSVLAGVVLAVAVLRGRPEPKAASAGRSFSPPPQAAQVPASVGAPSSGAEATSAWSTTAAPAPTPAPPPPPPTPYTAPAAGPGDDVATKAAGAALLGRLRGKRGDKAGDAEPEPMEMAPAAGFAPVDATTEMPAMVTPIEDEDDFPIAGYDGLRATELLSQLPALDRNQLEAVRDRESSGKNRFTIMSRVDALLATSEEPAWEVDDGEWDADDGAEGEPEVLVAEAVADDGFDDEIDEEDEDEAPMATGGAFPIPSYETLTVGQILPRLSDLDADELAQVRTREQMGRSRGTILDRIDRLVSRRAPVGMAMPAAPSPAPAPASVRKTAARRAPAVAKTTAPAVKRVAKVPARRTTAIVVPPVAPAAPRKAAVRKAPPAALAAPRKARAPKAVPPVIPTPPAASTMKQAVKKARAAKAKKA